MELVVVCLHLYAVGEVAQYRTVDIEAHEALGESVARVIPVGRGVCILAYGIASELWGGDISRHRPAVFHPLRARVVGCGVACSVR